FRVEDIDETVARPRLVLIVIRRFLLGIRDEEQAADVLNPKGREARRYFTIKERARHKRAGVENIGQIYLVEDAVEHVNRSSMEIGGVEEGTEGVVTNPLAEGTVTTSGEVGLGTTVPSPLWSVEVPLPLLATHQGPMGLMARPHGLTRLGSTRSARPARSETRLCCS